MKYRCRYDTNTNIFKIQIQMLPGEIQVQGEAANNPSSVEEKPGQQQGSAEEM